MPSILRRIKKKEFQGFKEFVRSLETTAHSKRVDIIQAAILEDPVYMTYVFKNMTSPEEVLTFASDSIDVFIKSLPNGVLTFAKAYYKSQKIDYIKDEVLPKGLAKDFVDELDLIKQLTLAEKEAAGYMIINTYRDLQDQEFIYGKAWDPPPQHILKEEASRSEGHTIMNFEDGQVAAEGDVIKGNREGTWVHYYENGVIMARGNWRGGMKNGEWTFWHSNGKKKSQGVYREDVREGDWKFFDRTGNSVDK